MFVAFVVMCLATVASSVTGVTSSRRAGDLARRTYDQTVVTTSYAGAASSDFNGMRGELARVLLNPRGAGVDMEVLRASFERDISIAAAKAGAPDVSETVAKLRVAVSDWLALSNRLSRGFTPEAWHDSDRKAREVERGLGLLIAQVSRIGFDYRADAGSTVDRDIRISVGLMTAAVIACAVVALAISRRITKPLEEAVTFADRVAEGDFSSPEPARRSDEFGDLANSMVRMRREIGELLRSKAQLQEQSQARVAEALDGSGEGVLIATVDGTIQIANAPAIALLGFDDGMILEGMSLADVARHSRLPAEVRRHFLEVGGATTETTDVRLEDGRWIRSSRSHTREGGFVGLYSDMSEARAQRDALASANANLDGAMANMSQGLVVFDAAGAVVLANPKVAGLLGVGEASLAPGATHADLVAEVLGRAGVAAADLDRHLRREARLLRTRRAMVRTLEVGGRELSVTQAPMPDGGTIATLADVTEQRRVEGRMNFLANHDALTQLPNRTLLRQRVEEAIVRARRGRGFAVHCLDLDKFKFVNDTMGHAVGDELLVQVAERLSRCLRETDTVARLGGDEFAILQADVSDEAGCAVLANRVLESVSAPYSIQGNDVVIGVSIGIACGPENGLDHGALLQAADTALYKSKEEGRGRYSFFAAELNDRLVARRDLERDLRSALENGELSLHYQPLLDASTQVICGFEALMRWRHPTRGMVPPSDFIPIAEETGMIRAIGAWAMDTACRQAMAWPVEAKVAVNVSAVQLRDADFRSMVTATLARTGLPAARLELEITESTLMSDGTNVVEVLQSLRETGVSVAMDDFGTGFSSLSSLNSFPFTRIKIDRSFVRDLHERSNSQQIIRAIVTLGKTMGMSITAEGVETRLQLAFLEEVGCDVIQGYLVGRPIPDSEVAATLRAQTKPLAA